MFAAIFRSRAEKSTDVKACDHRGTSPRDLGEMDRVSTTRVPMADVVRRPKRREPDYCGSSLDACRGHFGPYLSDRACKWAGTALSTGGSPNTLSASRYWRTQSLRLACL